MDFVGFIDFLEKNITWIKENPISFIMICGVSFLAGYKFSKIINDGLVASLKGTADLHKEQRDNALKELERKVSRENEDVDEVKHLRAALDALRADVNNIPKISYGLNVPDNSFGKDGDVYFQVADEVAGISTSIEKRISFVDDMFLNKPFNSFEQALQASEINQKPVFLVVYDADHPELSKLAYALGYFLEFSLTRKLIDQYFVAAVVPSQDFTITKLIPEDDPLEECRLVVLNNGKVIYSDSVYANAKEALKIVRSIIKML
ncbi:hypothetical protein [Pseudomonas oryzihabitans]|uniref:hypothetical protein n=1 Tax=Pseudomonas oryzihabitans TaxID=47885 RepID=UPI00241C5B2A|nr:hypothetical protein [Pseudomonas oryzihabitans]